jgi:hypothetical protein
MLKSLVMPLTVEQTLGQKSRIALLLMYGLLTPMKRMASPSSVLSKNEMKVILHFYSTLKRQYWTCRKNWFMQMG